MPPELQTVVDDHYQNLYRFALSLTRSSDDAWDLTQEAFLRLAKKRATIRSTAAIKSWLYTTLYREFIRVSKKSARFDSLEDRPHIDTPDQSQTNQIRKAEAKDVLTCLLNLKDGYRQVVSLYFLESYSYKEIAEILGIPIGTVMSRLARGKDMLKTALITPQSNGDVIPFQNHGRKSSNG